MKLLIVAVRNACIPEAMDLVKTTGLAYFNTLMAKGEVAENLDTYGGLYGGGGSEPAIRKFVESSDCVLWLGSYPSDFNT
jgi:pyruvate decarboxylase